jgi:hypothetical protein
MVEINTMEKIMINFIRRYYPISRYKFKNRFKRGILFDDGHIYQISDKKEMNILYSKLINILKIVFNLDSETCKLVLKQVL